MLGSDYLFISPAAAAISLPCFCSGQAPSLWFGGKTKTMLLAGRLGRISCPHTPHSLHALGILRSSVASLCCFNNLYFSNMSSLLSLCIDRHAVGSANYQEERMETAREILSSTQEALVPRHLHCRRTFRVVEALNADILPHCRESSLYFLHGKGQDNMAS